MPVVGPKIGATQTGTDGFNYVYSNSIYASGAWTLVDGQTATGVSLNSTYKVSTFISTDTYTTANGAWVDKGPIQQQQTQNPPTSVSAPALASTQGYNSQTQVYETMANSLSSGDNYLILYGNFAPSGNTISINGQAIGNNPTIAQSASQINIPLNLITFAGSSFTVSVSNTGGISQDLTIQVASAVTIGISQADAAAFITNLYATVLNRQPDASGLSYYVGELTSGAKTEDQVQAEFITNAATELTQDIQNIILQANTASYGSLNSYQQQTLTAYLTSNPNSLTSQNFLTFTPGSIFAWSLGMGASTSLNATAKSLGFTTYDSIQGMFTKQQPPTALAPSLSSTQGYDSQTQTYDATANTISSTDDYLILFGNFSASGNTILINGKVISR